MGSGAHSFRMKYHVASGGKFEQVLNPWKLHPWKLHEPHERGLYWFEAYTNDQNRSHAKHYRFKREPAHPVYGPEDHQYQERFLYQS